MRHISPFIEVRNVYTPSSLKSTICLHIFALVSNKGNMRRISPFIGISRNKAIRTRPKRCNLGFCIHRDYGNSEPARLERCGCGRNCGKADRDILPCAVVHALERVGIGGSEYRSKKAGEGKAHAPLRCMYRGRIHCNRLQKNTF